jgi:hypothetical protein
MSYSARCLPHRYFKLIPIFSGSGTPLPLLQLMLVAVALGSLLFPNLVMLFYPVTRGSVVLQASGISYPDAIRYVCQLKAANITLDVFC